MPEWRKDPIVKQVGNNSHRKGENGHATKISTRRKTLSNVLFVRNEDQTPPK